MAARNFTSNRLYNFHLFPVHLDMQATIGASGAPTIVTSAAIPNSTATQGLSKGIKSITRLAAGTYQLRLDDNYSSIYGLDVTFRAVVSGSNIPVDATTAGLSIGTIYEITAVGTATTAANWVTLGLPSGLTATVGQVFKALTTGTGIQSGAGTVKVLVGNNISTSQLLGSSQQMLSSQPFVQGQGGGYVTFQTMAPVFTAGAYTPAGTISAPVFTGSAMSAHAHDLLVLGGQAASTTNNLAAYAGPTLGKEQAVNATFAGASSAVAGGVLSNSAGTPAGTNSIPIFTGTAASLTGTMSMVATDPTNGTTMYVRMILSNSSVQ